MAKSTKKEDIQTLEAILLEMQDSKSRRYRMLKNADVHIGRAIDTIKRLISEVKKMKKA